MGTPQDSPRRRRQKQRRFRQEQERLIRKLTEQNTAPEAKKADVK
jgi:hypothetical protein